MAGNIKATALPVCLFLYLNLERIKGKADEQFQIKTLTLLNHLKYNQRFMGAEPCKSLKRV